MSDTVRVHASLDVPVRLNQAVVDGAAWTLASRIRFELNARLAAQNKAIRERREQFHATVDQFRAKQLTVEL